MRLYIANKNYSSWSLRPWLLMKALGIPFEERLMPFADVPPGGNWAEFRKFSPSGKVPCLVDGEQVVWESLAIVEYLAEKYPPVWPEASTARSWARSAASEMHAGFGTLRNICTMNCGVRVKLHTVPAALQADIDRFAELWSEGLQRFGGPWLAGKTFTAVDAFFAPVAFRVQTYGLQLPAEAQDYARRLLATQPMQAWYEAALKETWRESSHEAELKQAGTVVADLRTA
jgi:glutathione S-transferase